MKFWGSHPFGLKIKINSSTHLSRKILRNIGAHPRGWKSEEKLKYPVFDFTLKWQLWKYILCAGLGNDWILIHSLTLELEIAISVQVEVFNSATCLMENWPMHKTINYGCWDLVVLLSSESVLETSGPRDVSWHYPGCATKPSYAKHPSHRWALTNTTSFGACRCLSSLLPLHQLSVC